MAGVRGIILTAVLVFSLPVSGWPASATARPGPHSAANGDDRTAKATVSCEPIRRVETAEKVVALTLDDGPDPKYTPIVLEMARKRHIALTFFVTGEHVRRYPRLARRIEAEGHAIGNHTWSHTLLPGLSEAEDAAEIEACGGEIEKVCGQPTGLFRPPKGKTDENVARAAESLGYVTVLWSVALESHDATTPQQMAERVLQRVQPGAIILAHDGRRYERVRRDKTMTALPILIEGLQAQGYRFVTVPQLLALSAERASVSKAEHEEAQGRH